MKGLKANSFVLRLFILVMLAAASAFASAQLHGAIYTSLGDGTIVNQNTYVAKPDVHLNGGPQGGSPNGLPDGDYFFQVTDPSGTVLLSEDDVRNRRLQVVGGRVFGHKADPVEPVTYPGHSDGTFNNANGSIPVQLIPFADTPNTGGVYKVWLIPVGDYDPANAGNPGENFGFKSGNTKTDNFKVLGENPPPPSSLIKGVKFYDLDHDGERDPEDPIIPGWEIRIVGTLGGQPLDITVFTDINGEYTAEFDVNTEFEICETLPDVDPEWVQSHPSVGEAGPGGTVADADQCWTGTVGEQDILGLDFGNYRSAELSGVKFYDANVNGLNDDGQFVVGVRINVYVDGILYDPDNQGYTTVTGVNGAWSVDINLFDSEEHTFVVEEILPGTSDPDCWWVQTAPALVDGARKYTVTTSTEDLDFGNVCVCQPTEGRTLGFWSNRNGQNILKDNDPAWRTLLNNLSLRNANGSDYNVPATAFSNAYGNFRTWLLNGTATNMAYMLSVQLAASTLNVAYMGLDAADTLWLTPSMAACYGSNTVTLGQVHADAQAALAADGLTLDGDPNRAHQECLKNILDASNNNQLPVIEGEPCDVVYP